MCCVTAGQSHQCMGMNIKASLNEVNMNCKLICAIRAADSERTEGFCPCLRGMVPPKLIQTEVSHIGFIRQFGITG